MVVEAEIELQTQMQLEKVSSESGDKGGDEGGKAQDIKQNKQIKKNKKKARLTQAIGDLNKKLQCDERVDICLLPVCDGMYLVRKR